MRPTHAAQTVLPVKFKQHVAPCVGAWHVNSLGENKVVLRETVRTLSSCSGVQTTVPHSGGVSALQVNEAPADCFSPSLTDLSEHVNRHAAWTSPAVWRLSHQVRMDAHVSLLGHTEPEGQQKPGAGLLLVRLWDWQDGLTSHLVNRITTARFIWASVEHAIKWLLLWSSSFVRQVFIFIVSPVLLKLRLKLWVL